MAQQRTFFGHLRDGASWTVDKASRFPLRVEVHHKENSGVGGWLIKEGLAIASVAGLVLIGGVFGIGSAVGAAAYTAATLLGVVNFADDFRRVTDSFERRTITKMEGLRDRTGMSNEQTLELVSAAKDRTKRTSPILVSNQVTEPLTQPKKHSWANYVLNRSADKQTEQSNSQSL